MPLNIGPNAILEKRFKSPTVSPTIERIAFLVTFVMSGANQSLFSLKKKHCFLLAAARWRCSPRSVQGGLCTVVKPLRSQFHPPSVGRPGERSRLQPAAASFSSLLVLLVVPVATFRPKYPNRQFLKGFTARRRITTRAPLIPADRAASTLSRRVSMSRRLVAALSVCRPPTRPSVHQSVERRGPKDAEKCHSRSGRHAIRQLSHSQAANFGVEHRVGGLPPTTLQEESSPPPPSSSPQQLLYNVCAAVCALCKFPGKPHR